jgi:putative tricarboxylic transport membrane protein
VGGPGPALYPRVLIVLLAVAMVVRMAQQVRENRAAAVPIGDQTEAPPEEGAELDIELIDNNRVLLMMGFSILYVLATLFMGWLIATFIFSIVFLVISGKRNPLIVLPTALVFALGFTYVFVKIVYISLPTGSGVFDLITVRLFELMGIY